MGSKCPIYTLTYSSSCILVGPGAVTERVNGGMESYPEFFRDERERGCHYQIEI